MEYQIDTSLFLLLNTVMYNILRIVILVVSYYVLRCMYCILCYLITKLTCSIEEPLCGNAIKSLLLLLLLLFYQKSPKN